MAYRDKTLAAFNFRRGGFTRFDAGVVARRAACRRKASPSRKRYPIPVAGLPLLTTLIVVLAMAGVFSACSSSATVFTEGSDPNASQSGSPAISPGDPTTASTTGSPANSTSASPSGSPMNAPDSALDDDQLLSSAATEALAGREGAVIVMDPDTGRLRAVVNPRLAFEQAFPPGSTIKPFTALAAMRAGLIDPHTRIMCGRRYSTAGFQIVCSHPVSRSPFNLAHALAYSCNYYFAVTAERLSQGTFNSLLSSFGFGTRTGGGSGAESAGSLPQRSWQLKNALGEGDQFLVTPIQMLRAYVALVGGGHLYRPHTGSAASFVPQIQSSAFISSGERDVLVEGMRGAVIYGTAVSAKLGSLPTYAFGKTGTSTASDGFRTQGWFAGFISKAGPAGQPNLAVLVFLKRSHGADCASIAKSVFEEYLRQTDHGTVNAKSVSRIPEAPGSGPTATRTTYPGTAAGLGLDPLGLRRSPMFVGYPSSIGTPPAGPTVATHPDKIKVHLVTENSTATVSLDQYCVGVLRAEASVEDRIEALKAQAVVSRTFALKNLGRHSQQGYDFCSTTHCQRYAAKQASARAEHVYERAVAETSGQVLVDDRGNLVDAYFHASCGGATANIESLWGVVAPPYLRGVRDDYCRSMPNANWTAVVASEKLARALGTDPRTAAGPVLKSISVAKQDATGRAEVVAIEGNRTVSVRGWDFKIIVGRSLGWNVLKSSWFDVTRSGNDFVFHGHGFGHGLGLCQEGAHVMAKRGSSYAQILAHYFPTTRVSAPVGAASRNSDGQIANVRMASASGLGAPALTAKTRSPPSRRGEKPFRSGPDAPLSDRLGELISSEQGRGNIRVPLATAKLPEGTTRYTLAGEQGSVAVRLTLASQANCLHIANALDLGVAAGFPGATQPHLILSSEHFQVSYTIPSQKHDIETVLDALEAAHRDLTGRLEAASVDFQQAGRISVVVNATTQDFIAATGQPWWAAGATRGHTIQLQPLAVLRRRNVLASTLRHECAHLAIDTIGQGKTPRWLAEGLAIYFAHEGPIISRYTARQEISVDELERRLAVPGSAQEMRTLYAAAFSRVAALVRARGEAAVWTLISKPNPAVTGASRR
jgi:SpoIID/LytB domain protein